MHSITIIVRTSDDLTQRSMTDVVHGYRGASIKRHATDMNAQPGITEPAARREEMEESYCTLMASAHGGLLEVSPQNRQDLVTFLNERKDTLVELACVVVIVSPDEESQRNAVTLLDATVPGSLGPEQCRLLLVDCPRDTQPESAFGQVYTYLGDKQLDGLVVPAVVCASRAFEQAQAHKLSLGALIHRAVDIEGEFAAARTQGASEKKLHTLSRRLMAARTVVAAAREFERAYDLLGLPRIGKDEWLREAGASTHRATSR
ncbi:hypothetical protein [Paraburkholderia diazotrophica]|uniref:hypothetical protein n=1 Tax=Paraburkholderia diazotrophica TaxID=667676 RepID=UPI00317C888D